jgi:hypothetical protein
LFEHIDQTEAEAGLAIYARTRGELEAVEPMIWWGWHSDGSSKTRPTNRLSVGSRKGTTPDRSAPRGTAHVSTGGASRRFRAPLLTWHAPSVGTGASSRSRANADASSSCWIDVGSDARFLDHYSTDRGGCAWFIHAPQRRPDNHEHRPAGRNRMTCVWASSRYVSSHERAAGAALSHVAAEVVRRERFSRAFLWYRLR